VKVWTESKWLKIWFSGERRLSINQLRGYQLLKEYSAPWNLLGDRFSPNLIQTSFHWIFSNFSTLRIPFSNNTNMAVLKLVKWERHQGIQRRVLKLCTLTDVWNMRNFYWGRFIEVFRCDDNSWWIIVTWHVAFSRRYVSTSSTSCIKILIVWSFGTLKKQKANDEGFSTVLFPFMDGERVGISYSLSPEITTSFSYRGPQLRNYGSLNIW